MSVDDECMLFLRGEPETLERFEREESDEYARRRAAGMTTWDGGGWPGAVEHSPIRDRPDIRLYWFVVRNTHPCQWLGARSAAWPDLIFDAYCLMETSLSFRPHWTRHRSGEIVDFRRVVLKDDWQMAWLREMGVDPTSLGRWRVVVR